MARAAIADETGEGVLATACGAALHEGLGEMDPGQEGGRSQSRHLLECDGDA